MLAGLKIALNLCSAISRQSDYTIGCMHLHLKISMILVMVPIVVS